MRIARGIICWFAWVLVSWLSAAELVVCWGNQGDVPAVALLEKGREPCVLLPGGHSDGTALAGYLKQRGMLQLETMFMPTGAPFPRGGASLTKVCRIRQVIVAQDLRSRLPWHELQAKLTSEGTALKYLAPIADKCWQSSIGGWRITYRRSDSGTLQLELGEFQDGKLLREFRCEETRTGVFEVREVAGNQLLLEIPKSNQSGVREISLGD